MTRKPNAMLARIEAAYEVKRIRFGEFTRQQCQDIMQIAAGEFGMNPKQVHDFTQLYMATFMEYAETCLMDAKNDKEIWYTWAKLDERLQQATGKYFIPREERYR